MGAIEARLLRAGNQSPRETREIAPYLWVHPDEER
jgi:hypothetical protein